MLTLITAKPGSFKSAKAATLAIKYLKEGRPVYTNIDQFEYEGAMPLPDNSDWRNTPDGSVVIYDEAQQFEFLQYKGREKLSSDGRVKELETHRHTGHDIILVTQSPSFLHNHVLSLVGSHYHLHRAYGRGFADVFLWRYAVTMPDSTGAKNKAESHEKFKPDTKIFDQYKSTTLDTHKLKIPPLYFKLGGFVAAVVLLVGYMVFGSDNPYLSASKIKENADTASGKKPPETTLVGSQAASVTTAFDPNIECRKGANVDRPECVEWFNNLSKSGGSAQSVGSVPESTLVAYNPNEPFKTDEIQDQIQYEVTSKPVLSGCMTNRDGSYTAYTQQGTKLKVSQSDCKKIMAGDRPFNYFAEQKQAPVTTVQNLQQQNQNTQFSDSITTEQLAKYEQAKKEGLI
ncbi:zonular occludens toxin domain-containing protein [Acinetobacter sp. GXMZU3951]